MVDEAVEAGGEPPDPFEEQEDARKEKEARLARIAAVNAGQVTGGQSLLGKASTVLILIGVLVAALYIADPNNCEFLPTTKGDTCMAQVQAVPQGD